MALYSLHKLCLDTGGQYTKLNVKKEAPTKEIIRTRSKDFEGTLSDAEVITLAKVSRNTYYRYKRELRNGE